MIFRFLLLCMLVATLLNVAGFAAPVWAKDERVEIHCDETGCTPSDLAVSANTILAPGLGVSRTIKIFNDSATQQTVAAGWEGFTGEAEVSRLILVSWRNGSHKVLWQGPIDSLSEIALGAIPRHSSRLYTLTITLPETAGNEAGGRSFELRPYLTVSAKDSSPASSALSADVTDSKASDAGRLETEAEKSWFGLVVPDLHWRGVKGVSDSKTGMSPIDRLEQSARQNSWLVWLLMALELVGIAFLTKLPRANWAAVGIGVLAAVGVWLYAESLFLVGLSVAVAIGVWCLTISKVLYNSFKRII